MSKKRDIFAETGIQPIEKKRVASVSSVTGIPELEAQPPAKPRPLLERLADIPEKIYYKGKEFSREVGEEIREQAPVVAGKLKEAGKSFVEYAQEYPEEEPVKRTVVRKVPKKTKRSKRRVSKPKSDSMYQGDSIYGDAEGGTMYEEAGDMYGSTEVDLWGNRAERKSKNMLDDEVL
jgi:hypothetical protein